jgi:hypothetical protein
MAALLAVVCLAGCGARPQAAPLDEDLARASLKAALEAWKKGDSAETLKTGSPPIIAQDPDWVTGQRLLAYEFAGEGSRDADNLFVPVKLTLKAKNGRQSSKSVSYVIGTSPHVMVFRQVHRSSSP